DTRTHRASTRDTDGCCLRMSGYSLSQASVDKVTDMLSVDSKDRARLVGARRRQQALYTRSKERTQGVRFLCRCSAMMTRGTQTTNDHPRRIKPRPLPFNVIPASERHDSPHRNVALHSSSLWMHRRFVSTHRLCHPTQ